MNEKEQLVMEQEIEKGHLAKATLVFLNSFLQEQQVKVQSMIKEGDDIKADLVIADLRALSRVAETLSYCVKMSEKAEKISRS
ncbi:MAG: hypothetical protein IJ859_10965 [Synergistaceae bacterium]|nr:hypothetical protein [Synergistaceae bacterium]MBR2209316.1 hypothetical protein [Synergistaceae bacterium]